MSTDTARPYLPLMALNPRLGLRTLDIDNDIDLLHSWFVMEYAYFWNMQHYSLEQTRAFYKDLLNSGHGNVFLGLYDNEPAFVVECYDPHFDPVGNHYAVQPGDIGMHFFVGPPSRPIRHFTRDVLRTIMAFLFFELGATRVVVEPDVRNEKIHRLNQAVGFVRDKDIQLPTKTAQLAFCTRSAFEHSLLQED
ncbi:GNAT family N-acetyltransferase [Azomonas macrocytogenes]|uniref:RimJ/RimL family protein N-acetyltransferase n=1 Tax=Azomonas macrocytogenes TaxID=69962 RepID=A0A839T334_AZOMA|nr:GNAT family N-acetyltransferase [Azomonas macrocytogenes]MBB3103070.1 RimJ/RimL family protein N-acetyltransferase [Azomonas macrocytogenes]